MESPLVRPTMMSPVTRRRDPENRLITVFEPRITGEASPLGFALKRLTRHGIREPEGKPHSIPISPLLRAGMRLAALPHFMRR